MGRRAGSSDRDLGKPGPESFSHKQSSLVFGTERGLRAHANSTDQEECWLRINWKTKQNGDS